jgi:hypothetical protein
MLNNAPIQEPPGERWHNAWVNWFTKITRMIQTGELYPTRYVSASVTAVLSDSIILADATAGPLTVTLPAAAATKNKRFVVKKTDSTASAVTLAPVSGQIDSAATYDITLALGSVDAVSDGTNYWIV